MNIHIIISIQYLHYGQHFILWNRISASFSDDSVHNPMSGKIFAQAVNIDVDDMTIVGRPILHSALKIFISKAASPCSAWGLGLDLPSPSPVLLAFRMPLADRHYL